jgi:hypothetical protein
MPSGVPIDEAQAVHAGGESALRKWISWNYFFVTSGGTAGRPQGRARQQAVSSARTARLRARLLS